jgi:pimeloyl-ACP methyl ester carboxylesterase
VKLATFSVGSGPRPTAILHGFLGSGRNLRTFATEWSKRDPSRTFHLPDLRGHGSSPPLDGTEGLAALAADVLETCVPEEIVGHSLGGRVALAALRLDPDLRRVTLLDISPSPITHSESGKVLALLRRAPDRAASRAEMRDWLAAHGLTRALAEWAVLNVSPDGAWRIDREALAVLHEAVNAEDLWSTVDERVSCVRGARSPYVSDTDATRLLRVTTVDAGHYVHVDALPALLDVVTES